MNKQRSLRGASAAIAFWLMVSASVLAQSPPAPSSQQQPTPQQAMAYFAGDWTLSGTTKVSPSSPSVPFSSTEHGELVPGGYFLEIHSVSHGPLGDLHSVRMMEYNPAKSAYTYNAYNSLGEHQVAVGKVQGDTWTWNAEEKMNGITTPGRYTVTLQSAYVYSFKSEVQKPDGTWVPVMEGKATRSVSK